MDCFMEDAQEPQTGPIQIHSLAKGTCSARSPLSSRSQRSPGFSR